MHYRVLDLMVLIGSKLISSLSLVSDVSRIRFQSAIVVCVVLLLTAIFAFAGAPGHSAIGEFGTFTGLDGARDLTVNLWIKTPDPSTLPIGYRLQAVLVEPIGSETLETFTGKKFRPETAHLYYSDKPVNSSMIVEEYPEWIIITENYSLGSNSTQAYTLNQQIPPDMTVGWFYGYPGYMRGGTLHVYQFESHTAYRIYSTFLTKEQTLAIMRSLLRPPATTTTVTSTKTTIETTTTTATSVERVTEPSTYALAIGATIIAIILALLLILRRPPNTS